MSCETSLKFIQIINRKLFNSNSSRFFLRSLTQQPRVGTKHTFEISRYPNSKLKRTPTLTAFVTKRTYSINVLMHPRVIGSQENLMSVHIAMYESIKSYRVLCGHTRAQQNMNRVFVLQRTTSRVVWGMKKTEIRSERFLSENI